ncbi:Z-ring formation inhibitor MciZ [Mesobacillus maritimus]|nr:Z-ring formation inhibitor MciZ [Mesobacillus maritimus]MCM3586432.1 Z-ring formation inhibitor MciZ [Mesobacillus maritimus]MCM3669536.1 Z-ring formation inhibitor MciZ [Mesobacillus maritimus]
MKVYVYEHGFIMSGKAWEIRQKLKEYQKDYHSVKEWVNSVSKSLPRSQ